MVTVVLPRSLAVLFPGIPHRAQAPAGTVREVIAALDIQIPGLRDRVCAGGELRPHIKVFVGGEPAGLATTAADGETVHIIPAISGG